MIFEKHKELYNSLLNGTVESGMGWDDWLAEVENELRANGYRRYNQNLKSEDFAYWTVFSEEGEKLYQVGVLFYDFRKYAHVDSNANRISFSYECMLIGDDRIEMSVGKNIQLSEFEEMAKTFHETMSKHGSVV